MSIRSAFSRLTASVLACWCFSTIVLPVAAQPRDEQNGNPVAPLPTQPTPAPPNPFNREVQPTVPNIGPTPSNSLNLPAPTADAPTPNRVPRPRSTPVTTANNSTSNNSPFSPRLARAPFLLGDSFSQPLQILDPFATYDGHHHDPGVLLPRAGGGNRGKIAENTGALPMDRLIFNYNHFHNALTDFDNFQSNVDRFTMGFEKTCFDGLCSIDMRLPLFGNNDLSIPTFARNSTDIGNLKISLKALLTSDRDSALVAGMTLDLPTGGDVSAILNRDLDPLFFTAKNQAVYLAPFLGFLCAPNSTATHQGFLQVDVPTNGNDLQFSDSSTATTTANLLDQTLLYVDYSFSKLLYYSAGSRRGGCSVRRLSGLAEMHYTTTLNDSDIVQINTPLNDFAVRNFNNRIDVVNLTLGLHTVFSGGTQFRLGAVSPITDCDNRFFDFEVQAQVNVPL